MSSGVLGFLFDFFLSEFFSEFRPLALANDIADAVVLTTETGVILVAFDIEAIVKGHFFAFFEWFYGVDEDGVFFYPCFAIWVA